MIPNPISTASTRPILAVKPIGQLDGGNFKCLAQSPPVVCPPFCHVRRIVGPSIDFGDANAEHRGQTSLGRVRLSERISACLILEPRPESRSCANKLLCPAFDGDRLVV